MAGDREELEKLIQQRQRVLVFLPNTNELQRFVLSGAFDELSVDYDFTYVVPAADAARMQAAVPHLMNETNTRVLDIPQERFAKWSQVFSLACVRLADRSPSFAIRAGLDTFQPQPAGDTQKSKRTRPAAGGKRFDLRSPAFYAAMPVPVRKVTRRLALELAKVSFLPRRPRRMLSTLASLLDASTTAAQARDVRGFVAEADELLAGLEPLPELVELFDQLRPLFVIIPTSLLDLFCNDVLLACKEEEVACVVLQSGWDNLSSKGIILDMPTLLCTWGPQSSRHANEIQMMPALRVRDVGSPHYEQLRPADSAQIAQVRAGLGVGPGDKLVMFGGSFRQFDETGVLERLDAAIEAGGLGRVKIVYRPHPWRADRQDEDDFFQRTWKHVIFDPDMKDRYVRARQERGYLKREVPMFDMAYLARLLSSVDAVISPMSTLLIEALIMQRPTMAIAFGDGKHTHNPSVTAQMTHFAEIRKSPALVWCDDSARLEADIARLLAPGFVEETAGRRSKLLADIVQLEPGTYSQRLLSCAREAVEPTARKLRALRASRRRGTISHAYGANLIARDYAQVNIVDPEIDGYWMHGWIPAYHNKHTAFIALHKKDGQGAGYDYEGQIRQEKEEVCQWVSRKDQADFLLADGYKHVKAIGLPIAYIGEANVRRIPGSLLVMPPHSHKSHGADDPLAEAYADAIADCKRNFEHIWVCLHEDDLAKRQWVDSFEKRGIGVFPSADQSDPFTLRRLHAILSSFEYVTTNGYGSHIAYAAYCGAKPSIFGPFAEFPRDRIVRTHSVKMFPELVDLAYELCTEKALRAHYQFLFVDPHKAVDLRDWGRAEVGEPNRLSPRELAQEFNWSTMPARKAEPARGAA